MFIYKYTKKKQSLFEPVDQTLLIPKTVTGHNPEAVHQPPILKTYFFVS
jgi:hypothetical protein